MAKINFIKRITLGGLLACSIFLNFSNASEVAVEAKIEAAISELERASDDRQRVDAALRIEQLINEASTEQRSKIDQATIARMSDKVQEKNLAIVGAIARGLGKIGPHANSSLPALREALFRLKKNSGLRYGPSHTPESDLQAAIEEIEK